MQQTVVKTTTLFCTKGGRDAEYRLEIVQVAGGYEVHGWNGRRGNASTFQDKTPDGPVQLSAAEQIFAKVYAEKTHPRKGYVPSSDTSDAPVMTKPRTFGQSTGLLPQLLTPIDESEALELIDNDAFGLMQKIDGKRMIIKKTASNVRASNRLGLEVALPADLAEALAAIAGTFIIDGEFLNGKIFVFDLLERDGTDYRPFPFATRHGAAMDICYQTTSPTVTTVPLFKRGSHKLAEYRRLEPFAEGVVLKDLTASYNEGRPNSGGPARKHKFYETCTAQVSAHNAKRSVALVMFDAAGAEVPVGNVTVKPNQSVPPVGAFVECKYLYIANVGGSLYQPELLAERDDAEQRDCCVDSLKVRSESAAA